MKFYALMFYLVPCFEAKLALSLFLNFEPRCSHKIVDIKNSASLHTRCAQGYVKYTLLFHYPTPLIELLIEMTWFKYITL